MKFGSLVCVLAVSLLAPLVSMAAAPPLTAVVKVGKIRVLPPSGFRGHYRFGQSGERNFDGCTLQANFLFRFASNGGSEDPVWELVMEAKRTNADLTVYYDVLPSGRCALRGVELP